MGTLANTQEQITSEAHMNTMEPKMLPVQLDESRYAGMRNVRTVSSLHPEELHAQCSYGNTIIFPKKLVEEALLAIRIIHLFFYLQLLINFGNVKLASFNFIVRGEIQISYKKEVFHYKGSAAQAQIVQKGGGSLILGNIQGQTEPGSEHLICLQMSLLIAGELGCSMTPMK